MSHAVKSFTRIAIPVVASVFGGPALGAALGVSSAAGSAIAGGAAALALGGGKQQQPTQEAAPTVPTPITTPLPNDQAVQAAKKKSIAQQIASSGRASTIFTDTSGGTDRLGG